MNEKPTVNCSECGAEVPNNLDLCPQCGIEVDETNPTQIEAAREQVPNVDEREQENPTGTNKQSHQSERDIGIERTGPSTPGHGVGESSAGTPTSATNNVKSGIVSRFGFGAVVGAVGGVFLLAPLFLTGPDAFRLLFGGGKSGTPMAPYRAGLAVATAVTMAGGSLCLFAAALRLAGVRFDISRVTGALGILSGGVGIIMIFVV